MDQNPRAARILIVDRDRSSLYALGALLEDVGHGVGLAGDWHAAIELARAGRYGLVIAEIEPGQRVADAVRGLGAEPALRDVPLILLSRDGEQLGEWRAHWPTVVDSIDKPVDVARILASVDSHLRG